MKIPKQLKIGAHIVKVREIEMVDDTACSGDTQYVSGEIRINKDLTQTRKESTLIHEAMHHINTTLNHELLDSLSEQIYFFLKENKLLRWPAPSVIPPSVTKALYFSVAPTPTAITSSS